jgi:hypothetical protein
VREFAGDRGISATTLTGGVAGCGRDEAIWCQTVIEPIEQCEAVAKRSSCSSVR